MLRAFERQILRRIYGQLQDKRHWCPRWNDEIYNIYKYTNFVDDIKIRKLGWAGYIIRMEDERIPPKILNWKFHNTRPLGKPRARWEDVIRRDTSQILGMRGRR